MNAHANADHPRAFYSRDENTRAQFSDWRNSQPYDRHSRQCVPDRNVSVRFWRRREQRLPVGVIIGTYSNIYIGSALLLKTPAAQNRRHPASINAALPPRLNQMNPAPTIFTIPTYRLRDVAETVERYVDHFWSNGQSVKMMIFDDSSLANHQKYYSASEQTKGRPLAKSRELSISK